MPNPHRGEVVARFGGRAYTLRLTLQALAEIEAAFGVEDLAALGAHLGRGRLSSRELAAILGAALRGGGHALSDDEAAALPLDDGVEGLADAVARALRLALGGAPANPPPPGPPSPSTASSAS